MSIAHQLLSESNTNEVIMDECEGRLQSRSIVQKRNDSQWKEANLILLKQNSKRNEGDVKKLIDCFKDITFFGEMKQKYGQSVLKNICKNMMLEILPASTVLFSLGDFGTKFYIILSGSVGVKILQRPKPNLDADSSPKLKENKRVLTEVKILQQGETFGEMALLGNGKRLATIESKDDCTFAVVDKQTFMSFLKLDEEQKISTEIGFMSQVDIIKTWNYPDLLSLHLLTTTQNFSNGETVYKQGDSSQFVYIIRSGVFKLYKTSTIGIPSKMDEKLVELIGNKSNLYQQISRNFEISVIEVPEIVGDEEVVYNCKRKYTLKCVSGTGSVLVLSKQTFLDKICTDFNKQFYFKRKFRNLNKTRLQRLCQLKNRLFDFPNQQSYLNKDDHNCVIQKESERILKEINVKRTKQQKISAQNEDSNNQDLQNSYNNELLQQIIKQMENDMQEQIQLQQNKNSLAFQISYLEQNSCPAKSVSQVSENKSQKNFDINIANKALEKISFRQRISDFSTGNNITTQEINSPNQEVIENINYGAKSTELPAKKTEHSKSLNQLALRLKLPIVKSFDEQNQLLQGLKQNFRKRQLREEQNIVEFQHLFFSTNEAKQQQIERKKNQLKQIRSVKNLNENTGGAQDSNNFQQKYQNLFRIFLFRN